MTAIHFPAIFKSKMADETLRDGNKRGLYNFKESLHTLLIGIQAPVVQKVDNAIHRINHYPADSVVCFVNTLSAG